MGSIARPFRAPAPSTPCRPPAARFVVLGLATAALGACHHAPPAQTPVMFTEEGGLLRAPAGSPLRSQLAVAPVGVGAGTGVLVLPAVVEADPSGVANVLSPLAGRVVRRDARLGDRVRRGEALATLASGDYAQAVADATKAEDADRLARQTLARTQGVLAIGGGTVKDLEAARSGVAQADAEQTRAKARVAALSAGAGGSALVLRAPIDGVVTALSIAPGAMVDDPTAVLMTITDARRVFVTAQAPQADIGRLHPGEAVVVTTDDLPGRRLAGRVGSIDPVVAADTRRQKVRIPMDNPDGRLAPGAYATVSAPQSGPAGGVTAPQSALLMNNDAVTVLVEVAPFTFRRQAVTLGNETDTTAEVTSGLKPGDRIVTRGGVLFGD